MLIYIRAELYKLLHRKYTYIALGVMLALESLLVAAYAFHNAHSTPTPFGGAVPIIVELGIIGFGICLITADIVFAGQYKNSTLKNEVSFGLSRTQIYLGKFIAQTLLSILYLVAMMAFYLGACAIFLPLESEVAAFYSVPEALTIVGYFLAAGVPLWIGAQAAACMCQFLLQGEMTSSFLYMGLILMLESILQVVGALSGGKVWDILSKICEYLPRHMLETAKSVVGDPVFLGKAWLVGLFWVAACTAIGLYGFHKKEIK